MKQYKVQITDKALADMEEIYNYIAIQLQAPENAIGQYNRIAKAIEPDCGGYALFCMVYGEWKCYNPIYKLFTKGDINGS